MAVAALVAISISRAKAKPTCPPEAIFCGVVERVLARDKGLEPDLARVILGDFFAGGGCRDLGLGLLRLGLLRLLRRRWGGRVGVVGVASDQRHRQYEKNDAP
jgi:hypothetical protein